MKLELCTRLSLFVVFTLAASAQATERYVSPVGGNTPPYTTWDDAATKIQDAIDASVDGDTIWVTNGVYATGGKAMAGDLTNRVALDKAVTVQSVNGSGVTIIEGQGGSARTNGPGAVRCAWLADGATISGFTLQGGATLTSRTNETVSSGGGVWCASTNATVAYCILRGNSAAWKGGGAYSGHLSHCKIVWNTVTGASVPGGAVVSAILDNCLLADNSSVLEAGMCDAAGALECTLNNCAVTGNSVVGMFNYSYVDVNTLGVGATWCVLNNCTITDNHHVSNTLSLGAGAYQCTLNNCIVWNNRSSGLLENVALGTVKNSCTLPLASGEGNIDADPQLLADRIHLAATSPCRGKGSTLYASGTDLDGQPWTNPPSMGCDEWYPAPLPLTLDISMPDAKQVKIAAAAAGQGPFDYGWLKDGVLLQDGVDYEGTKTANLLVNHFDLGGAGTYSLVVSNAFGITTGEVANVAVHCVAASAKASVPPHTDWASAARNIQDAVDAAFPEEIVLVTNGVYDSGGKVTYGGLTNRVVVDKPLFLMSVNGPTDTVIEGNWDPISTNGPSATRCVWLGDGTSMSGFTLRDGATLDSSSRSAVDGGGAWVADTNVVLMQCVLTNNSARQRGGGIRGGTLSNCTLVDNRARTGGGASGAVLNRSTLSHNQAENGGGADGCTLAGCRIVGNVATNLGGGVTGSIVVNSWLSGNTASQGGGAYVSTLTNCTLVGNSAIIGGGIYYRPPPYPGIAVNCIIWGNSASSSDSAEYGTYAPIFVYMDYCCTRPMPIASAGVGNISVDPQLVDGLHLAVTSPCRGAGNALYVSGTDIDDEAWTNPPSMGCDEVWPDTLGGPLTVGLEVPWTEAVTNWPLTLTGAISGRASRLEWDFGDGPAVTNASYQTAHTWTNTGEFTVTLTAFNSDHPAGISTNVLLQLVALEQPSPLTIGKDQSGFHLAFMGQAGVNYVVEYATNLDEPVAWMPLSTVVNSGGMNVATDVAPTNGVRFYRIEVP